MNFRQIQNYVHATMQQEQVTRREQDLAKRTSQVGFYDETGLDKLVVIGTSTGGIDAVLKIVPFIPQSIQAAIVIIQHMPMWMTASYVERVQSKTTLPVTEVVNGQSFKNGRIYVVPGGYVLQFNHGNGKSRLIGGTGEVAGVLNINGSMEALVQRFGGKRIIGALLTGMGKDGAEGLLNIRRNGGFTIAEDQSTAVVFGMPREAIVLGAALSVLPCHRIAESIVREINTKS